MTKPSLFDSREIIYAGQLPSVSLDVFIQDQSTPPFQYYLSQELQTGITLTSPVNVGDNVIPVSAGHGFTATGEYIIIRQGSLYSQSRVVSVAGNDITINPESSNNYTTEAVVVRGNIDFDINGSVTPASFVLPMWGEVPIDIQTIIINLTHNTTGDDSLFGNLAALTNGLRIKKVNSQTQGLGNYQRNQDFSDFGAVVTYTDKAGGGLFSTKIALDIKNIYGVVIRLDSRINDELQMIVRDDLTSLTSAKISVMGQFTLGE